MKKVLWLTLEETAVLNFLVSLVSPTDDPAVERRIGLTNPKMKEFTNRAATLEAAYDSELEAKTFHEVMRKLFECGVISKVSDRKDLPFGIIEFAYPLAEISFENMKERAVKKVAPIVFEALTYWHKSYTGKVLVCAAEEVREFLLRFPDLHVGNDPVLSFYNKLVHYSILAPFGKTKQEKHFVNTCQGFERYTLMRLEEKGKEATMETKGKTTKRKTKVIPASDKSRVNSILSARREELVLENERLNRELGNLNPRANAIKDEMMAKVARQEDISAITGEYNQIRLSAENLRKQIVNNENLILALDQILNDFTKSNLTPKLAPVAKAPVKTNKPSFGERFLEITKDKNFADLPGTAKIVLCARFFFDKGPFTSKSLLAKTQEIGLDISRLNLLSYLKRQSKGGKKGFFHCSKFSSGNAKRTELDRGARYAYVVSGRGREETERLWKELTK